MHRKLHGIYNLKSDVYADLQKYSRPKSPIKCGTTIKEAKFLKFIFKYFIYTQLLDCKYLF